jgi:hypothetical protein
MTDIELTRQFSFDSAGIKLQLEEAPSCGRSYLR